MGEFCVFQKHVPVVEPELISDLAKLGVQVCGDSGQIHAHLWIPDNRMNDVLDIMENRGFFLSKPYHSHHHQH